MYAIRSYYGRPHAAVHQEVAVAAAHMPDVAAIEFLNPGLVDPGQPVANGADAIPILGRDAGHAASLSGRITGLRVV